MKGSEILERRASTEAVQCTCALLSRILACRTAGGQEAQETVFGVLKTKFPWFSSKALLCFTHCHILQKSQISSVWKTELLLALPAFHAAWKFNCSKRWMH